MNQTRLDDLLDALGSGSLTDAEQAELDTLIATDPEVAKQVARTYDLTRELADSLRPSSQLLPVVGEATTHSSNTEERHTTRRIRSRTRRTQRTSGRHRLIGIITAIAALIVVAVLINRTEKPERWLEGSADFANGGPIAAGQPLHVGAQLVTTGKATLCFADGTRVRLAVGSRLTVGEGPGKRLHLDHGRLQAHVTKQSESSPFQVQSAHAQVTVLGTAFDLAVQESRAELSVQEGVVRLQAAGIDTMVTVGQHRVVETAPKVAEPSPQDRAELFVRRSSVWAYRDAGGAPEPSWLQPGFDDSSWSRGPAPLGYDRNEVRQVITTHLRSDNPNQLTAWFRHEFTCEDPARFTRLILHVQRDDGVVIYLNGQELLRDNLPDGPLTEQTNAKTRIEKKYHDQDAVLLWVIPAHHLRKGKNCIAAEIHQYKASSTDVLFSLELQADARPIQGQFP